MNTELRKRYKNNNEIIRKLYSYYEEEKKKGLDNKKLNIILDKIKEIKK